LDSSVAMVDDLYRLLVQVNKNNIPKIRTLYVLAWSLCNIKGLPFKTEVVKHQFYWQFFKVGLLQASICMVQKHLFRFSPQALLVLLFAQDQGQN